MCDTFIALSNATENGSVIFGKNSDREPNEAHELVIIPHAYHDEGEMVKCTYIDIPQIAETNAVLLAKPFWIWGAEMGANEHNVVIGNEAVFSKIPAGKKPTPGPYAPDEPAPTGKINRAAHPRSRDPRTPPAPHRVPAARVNSFPDPSRPIPNPCAHHFRRTNLPPSGAATRH